MKTSLVVLCCLQFTFLYGENPGLDVGLEPLPPAIPECDKKKLCDSKLAKFQGIWKPITAEYEGEKLEPEKQKWTLIISDNTVLQLRRGRVHVEGRMEVNNIHKGVERAVWKFTNVPVTNNVIYSFEEEDVLVTCWNAKRNGVLVYPTVFNSTGEGSGQYLVVWKRQR